MSEANGTRIVWPTPVVDTSVLANAPKLRALSGARIGFLDNTKVNLDILFREIGMVLEKDYGVAETERVRKPTMAGPMTEANRDYLRRFDAIVTAMGD
jgi:hypothetical protein